MTIAQPEINVGSIVRARGREWVVEPYDLADTDLVRVRPLGGTEQDVTGILRNLEQVESATFPMPDPHDIADHTAARLLRDAVRLNIRAGAGPFRSFGRIAVEPRSYQLVPLLMALRLNPVRLLIADDVGIGKTIEAGLIARELFDRGEIQGMSVICPAHLCEQWQAELAAKFDIHAEIVRPGTVKSLERPLTPDQSIFEEYPFTVVSIDYVKSDKNRHEFIQSCPNFVIVDEAHTCASSGTRSTQLRHELLQELARGRNGSRHIVLSTATPHSGNEDAFRSLLSLLDPEFADLPADHEMTSDHPLRLKLANHLIQRRRGHIRSYLEEDTAFPTRQVREAPWTMNRETDAFYDEVRKYARGMVESSKHLQQNQQRISWWAALALMRAAVSSPASAIAALETRAYGSRSASDQAAQTDDIEAYGASTVLDADVSEVGEMDDMVPGADLGDTNPADKDRRKARELIAAARKLTGDKDAKLAKVTELVQELTQAGFSPIVFCRYIRTAEYVGQQLQKKFRNFTVSAVTGLHPPEDRKQRVADLATNERRILVATDCLSEGINLQEHFDAVIHYDLAWNPTRHEQREGRVDRFGQPQPQVRTVLLYGENNPVDRAVMDVLIRKAETIRQRLGVAVSVPQRSGVIMDSVFQAIFHGEGIGVQLQLGMDDFDEKLKQAEADLDSEWSHLEQREKLSETVFSHSAIHPEFVKEQLQEVRESLGSAKDVEQFVRLITGRLESQIRDTNKRSTLSLVSLPTRVREAAPNPEHSSISVGFDFPVPDNVYHLSRTSPIVDALCSTAIDGALDAGLRHRPARRAGVTRTSDVETETTLAIVRLRVHLRTLGQGTAREMLAEESMMVAWRWDDNDQPELLVNNAVEHLLTLQPTANTPDQQKTRVLNRILADEARWRPLIDSEAHQRAARVQDAHRRVRDIANVNVGRIVAQPIFPVDVLGLYIFVPA